MLKEPKEHSNGARRAQRSPRERLKSAHRRQRAPKGRPKSDPRTQRELKGRSKGAQRPLKERSKGVERAERAANSASNRVQERKRRMCGNSFFLKEKLGFSRFGGLWSALGERLGGSSVAFGLHLDSKLCLKSTWTGPKAPGGPGRAAPRAPKYARRLPGAAWLRTLARTLG